MSDWTKRCWVAEKAHRYPYVIWDIPDVRESLIEDYERAGWLVRGPYEVDAETTDGARLEGLRQASAERNAAAAPSSTGGRGEDTPDVS